ncbi:unnamed protein product [Ixodes pacificus]
MTPAETGSSAAVVQDSTADVLQKVLAKNRFNCIGYNCRLRRTGNSRGVVSLILSTEDVQAQLFPPEGVGRAATSPTRQGPKCAIGTRQPLHHAPLLGTSQCVVRAVQLHTFVFSWFIEHSTGKRKQDQMDYDCLEKRMKHDSFSEGKKIILEARRLSLEDSHLALEKERFLLESRAREEEMR